MLRCSAQAEHISEAVHNKALVFSSAVSHTNDTLVREQAEEIGRLKARIEELERSRGDNAGHARSSGIADVG